MKSVLLNGLQSLCLRETGIRKDNVLNKDQCEEVVSFRLGTPAGQEEQLQANTEFI